MSDGRSRDIACDRCRPKSSTDSQRQAASPKASPSLTKSGLVKSVPKWVPNFLSCFHTIEPNWLFSQITFTIGVFRRTAVSSSCTFMRKPPSPLTVTTCRSGWTIFAAIAHGSAKPMPARPFAMSTVLGSWAGNMRPIHSLCRPTSEMRMSLRPRALRSSQRARRLHGERVVVLRPLQPAEHDVPQTRRSPGVGDVAAFLGQAAEHVVEVADELDLGRVVGVDLRRDGVDHD